MHLEGLIKHSDSFLANLEQIPKAHPNAFIEATKIYLAMLSLTTCKGVGLEPGKMHSDVYLSIDARLVYGS